MKNVPPEKPVVSEELTEEQVYEKIGLYISLGDPEKAIEAFENAYDKAPESPETRLLYARLLMAAGQLSEARETLNGVLRDQPDYIDAMYSLALVEGASGRDEEEQRLLEEVVKRDPSNADANASLGELYLARKRTAQAKTAFLRSLEADPENLVARIGYGAVLMAEKKPEEAEAEYSKAIESAPDYPFAYVDRSRARIMNGDADGALADLDSAVALDPEYYWNYIDRGKLYLMGIGDLDAALADFNTAVIIDPEYFLGYVYRGRTYDSLDRRKEAIDDYQKVLRLNPGYNPVNEPLAILLYMDERWNEARVLLEKVYAADNEGYWYPLLISLCYMRADEEAASRKYLEKIISLLPRDSLYYHMARLYMEPGYDTYVTRLIDGEKNQVLKTQMLYYLGVHYLLQGKPILAQRYLMQVQDTDTPGLVESRLAERELAVFMK